MFRPYWAPLDETARTAGTYLTHASKTSPALQSYGTVLPSCIIWDGVAFVNLNSA